nr:hypothetical protein [Streptomyces scabichelini]
MTRPATTRELHRARRTVPLAANADHTRLLVVQPAKNPGRALRVLRHQLGGRLPIDILTTHYPDEHGQILLNVALSTTAHRTIRKSAAAQGQRPRDFLRERLTAAVAQSEQERARRLIAQLQDLLVEYTAEELLTCAASTLLSAHRSRSPSAP